MASNSNHCAGAKADGLGCNARPQSGSRWCFAHDLERAQERTEARARGGQNRSNAARLGNLCPPRLVATYDLLEQALREVHEGSLDPKQASAMASLAGAMTRVLTTGELEQRLRDLEAKTA